MTNGVTVVGNVEEGDVIVSFCLCTMPSSYQDVCTGLYIMCSTKQLGECRGLDSSFFFVHT